MPSILFVCTANICRSPMAEAILKKLVASRPDAGEWHIESAGTWAYYGSAAAPLSQYVMQIMGMDISSHQSKLVTDDLLKQFDVILTMERNHKEGLSLQFKRYTDRIFMVSEMVGTQEDITDPIGGDLEDYQETAKKLTHMISEGLDWIYQQAIVIKK